MYVVLLLLLEVYSASSISSNKAGTDMASVLQERLSKVAKDEVPGKKNLYLSLQIFWMLNFLYKI